jgi:hypothetical protein
LAASRADSLELYALDAMRKCGGQLLETITCPSQHDELELQPPHGVTDDCDSETYENAKGDEFCGR